ncbi:MAG: acyl-ACP--UDP-N-acetylglucosamine O-acyltransferase [Maricaulaceae bacterium]
MATIHPTSIVSADVELGEDVEIGPWCVIEGPVTIGARTKIVSHASIIGRTVLGDDCVLHPYVALGHPPQDVKYKGEDTRLEIGPRNVLREHVTMHLGTAHGRGVTTVGSDGLFMVGAHIAHDCQVGESVIFANNATLGGFCRVDDVVIMGGFAAVHQRSRVGRHAFVGASSIVVGDVIPYGAASGNHARLQGLNLVGLRRRNFPREVIHDLRLAYRLIAANEGTLQERIDEVAEVLSHRPEAMEIVEFMRADAERNLCLP